jgi:glycosyltransferase involved in cell wall biosynthesis
MKDFSVIFPSRDRQRLLTNLLKSIANTTYDSTSIEVLIAIDDDDTDMQSYAYWAKDNLPNYVKFFPIPRSVNFSRDYYTYLFGKSTGRWIIACNDDAEFTTPNWDKEAKNALESYIGAGPNIVYGWIEDGLGSHRLSQFGNYCCFPLLGRDGIEALGYYFSPNVTIWGADIWCEKLYRSIGRTLTMPFTISHISHHSGKREQDDLNKRLAWENRKNPCDMIPTREEQNKLISLLRNLPYIQDDRPVPVKMEPPKMANAFR